MATQPTLTAAPDLGVWKRPSILRRLGRTCWQYPTGVFAVIVLTGFVFVGVFGPSIAPYDPRGLASGTPLTGPTASHWFGTNSLGQDIFSRILAGARISLEIGGATVLIGATVGSFLGILAGYYMRWVDYIIQRSSEAFAAFPALILYFLIIAAFGRGVKTIIIALVISAVFSSNRVLRGATIIERNKTYVEAARSIGCTERRVFLRHVIPNVLPLTIIIMSGALGAAILAESALAFLGLGVAPGTPSWGIDMSGTNLASARFGHWYLVIFPGMAISLVVLAANLLGDALRDILDPRLRR